MVKADVGTPHGLLALIIVVRHALEVVEDGPDHSLVEQVALDDHRLVYKQRNAIVRAQEFFDLRTFLL